MRVDGWEPDTAPAVGFKVPAFRLLPSFRQPIIGASRVSNPDCAGFAVLSMGAVA